MRGLQAYGANKRPGNTGDRFSGTVQKYVRKQSGAMPDDEAFEPNIKLYDPGTLPDSLPLVTPNKAQAIPPAATANGDMPDVPQELSVQDARNRDLGLRARGGDKEARRLLIEENLKLVGFVLDRKFKRLLESKPGLRDDLEGQGYLILTEAADSYNPDKGAFSTHATNWLYGKLRTYLAENRLIRLPRSRLTELRDLRDTETALRESGGGTAANDQALCEAMGITQQKLLELRSLAVFDTPQPASLDMPPADSHGDGKKALIDMLADKSADGASPLDEDARPSLDPATPMAKYQKALRFLSPREVVVVLRHGVDGISFADISREMADSATDEKPVSADALRGIYQKAVIKLEQVLTRLGMAPATRKSTQPDASASPPAPAKPLPHTEEPGLFGTSVTSRELLSAVQNNRHWWGKLRPQERRVLFRHMYLARVYTGAPVTTGDRKRTVREVAEMERAKNHQALGQARLRGLKKLMIQYLANGRPLPVIDAPTLSALQAAGLWPREPKTTSEKALHMMVFEGLQPAVIAQRLGFTLKNIQDRALPEALADATIIYLARHRLGSLPLGYQEKALITGLLEARRQNPAQASDPEIEARVALLGLEHLGPDERRALTALYRPGKSPDEATAGTDLDFKTVDVGRQKALQRIEQHLQANNTILAIEMASVILQLPGPVGNAVKAHLLTLVADKVERGEAAKVPGYPLWTALSASGLAEEFTPEHRKALKPLVCDNATNPMLCREMDISPKDAKALKQRVIRRIFSLKANYQSYSPEVFDQLVKTGVLDTLKPAERQVFALRVKDGKTYDAIAEETKLDRNTVYMRFTTAVRKVDAAIQAGQNREKHIEVTWPMVETLASKGLLAGINVVHLAVVQHALTEGLSNTEIGNRLGMTSNRVQVVKSTVLKRIREAWNQAEDKPLA